MELASSRAMNVFLRLRSGLSERGLTYKADYHMKVIARVQPDGTTPEAFRATGTNQASFQYVRVDLKDA